MRYACALAMLSAGIKMLIKREMMAMTTSSSTSVNAPWARRLLSSIKELLNGINLVNLKDFALLAGNWQLTGPDLVGDINRNLVVNSEDLSQIVKYWLSECSQP
jgi:hypothetical protein